MSAGDSVFNSFLMIGTQLWNKLSAVPEFRDIENGNLSFKIPDLQPDNSWKKTITSPGKLIQDETDFKKIWSWIYEQLDLKNAKLSEVNAKDKFYLWLYFAKVEEPVVALQGGKGRLLLKISEGKLIFIELTEK